jgi:hypothetical protein
MKPQYVRVIMSSNKDLQYHGPSQNAIHLKTIHPVMHSQQTVRSVQCVNRFTSTTAATPTRIIINSLPQKMNLSNETKNEKANNAITVVPVLGTSLNLSTSSASIRSIKSNSSQVIAPTDSAALVPATMTPSTSKRTYSHETTQRSKKVKLEETGKPV